MRNFYLKALENLKKSDLYRSLICSDTVNCIAVQRGETKFISFCSNDYLGLSHNALVKKAAIEAIQKYGVGSGASRYVTGNNSLYGKLEKQIAKMKNCEDAIVFSSGYAGAIGIIPALAQKGDLIVADRLIHSSLIDGSKLSGAKLMRFLHNDVSHVKKILEENRGKFEKCVILTETVFSMDGDAGEIEDLLTLAKEFDAILVSDAAHDLFLKNGFGNSCENHLQIGTLSKAVGSLGGYCAGDKDLINYLRNFAKSAIYSTALPPAVLAASLKSLEIIQEGDFGKKALENAEYFCELMNLPKPESAIVPIIIGENKKVLEIAKKVEQAGMLISAIRPPTVETGKARLRITFSSMHEKDQIKKLADKLARLLQKN